MNKEKRAADLAPGDRVLMVNDIGTEPYHRVVRAVSKEFGVPVIRFHGTSSVLRCHPDRAIALA
jgi:hypothetical protein